MKARLRRSKQQLARQRVLIAFAVVGLVGPNAILLSRLAHREPLYDLYTLSSLLLATTTFLVWVAWDAVRSGVERWWALVPAALLLGLCFALPVYLLLRERGLNSFPPAHRAPRGSTTAAGGQVWR